MDSVTDSDFENFVLSPSLVRGYGRLKSMSKRPSLGVSRLEMAIGG